MHCGVLVGVPGVVDDATVLLGVRCATELDAVAGLGPALVPGDAHAARTKHATGATISDRATPGPAYCFSTLPAIWLATVTATFPGS